MRQGVKARTKIAMTPNLLKTLTRKSTFPLVPAMINQDLASSR
jgi:hypothetical protein